VDNINEVINLNIDFWGPTGAEYEIYPYPHSLMLPLKNKQQIWPKQHYVDVQNILRDLYEPIKEDLWCRAEKLAGKHKIMTYILF
jgi:hypothetical protein